MTRTKVQTGLKKIIHRADTRGVAEHGWLHSSHTFSFASYYNAKRMGFGKLRVINDDVVEPGSGFGTHGHDNMEIISIPLSGALRHKDSMGNTHVIKQGEVQIMSAGTGITHSEYNDSTKEQVNFLQIWVLPKERNIKPRYGQQAFDAANRHNRFDTVISPDKNASTIWINQDAFFHSVILMPGNPESIRYINRAMASICLSLMAGSRSLTRHWLSVMQWGSRAAMQLQSMH